MVLGISLVLLWGFGLWFLDGMFNWFGSLSSNTSGYETLWLPKITWSNESHNLKGFFEVNVGRPLVCGWQSLLLSRSYNFSGRWGTWSTNWASHFMQRRAYCLGIKCRDLLTEPRCPYGGVFLFAAGFVWHTPRYWAHMQKEGDICTHYACDMTTYLQLDTTAWLQMINAHRLVQSTNRTNMIRHVHVLKRCIIFTYFDRKEYLSTYSWYIFIISTIPLN